VGAEPAVKRTFRASGFFEQPLYHNANDDLREKCLGCSLVKGRHVMAGADGLLCPIEEARWDATGIPDDTLEAAKTFIKAFGVGVVIVPDGDGDFVLQVEHIPPAFFANDMPTTGSGYRPLSIDRVYFNHVRVVERRR
jgi:hypothetical protein